MRKIVMMIGLISVLATSANAAYWKFTPDFGTNPRGNTSTTWNSVWTY